MEHELADNPGPSGAHFEGVKCVFCTKGFTNSNPCVQNPNISRLHKLFQSCTERNDEIGKRILADKTNYENGTILLRYHRNCKAAYQTACRRLFSGQNVDNDNKENIVTPSKTRSSYESFDWKTKCFICSEYCDPKRDSNQKGYSRSWSMVETSIDASLQSIYSKVLEAAEKRNDSVMLNRLQSVPNGDLVAVDARYHRRKACLIKYYDTNNTDMQSSSNQTPFTYMYRNVAVKLKAEYENSIINERKVYLLSTLRKRFVEIAKDEGHNDAHSYRSAYFKKLLQDIWPNLCFVYQPGKSDLVCSSEKTVGEALLEAKELEKVLEQITELDIEKNDLPIETDESIVHKAVGVLRTRLLKNTKKLDHEYYSIDEMSLSSQKQFLDPLLYKAVCWMSDRTYFDEAKDTLNKTCLAIACDLASLVTSIPSPKHLGLAIHVHNEFGSRHLVEDLYNLGYSISYPELRMFLSSAANHALNTQRTTASGGLVPDNITPKDKGGKLIVGIADNWDHNEKTVDGKRTTHAMTSVLVSPKAVDNEPMSRLQRADNRSFDSKNIPGGSLCRIIPYKKPIHRPCPSFDPPVTIGEIRASESETVKVERLKELLYNFGRCSAFCDDVSEEVNCIPSWNIFQAATSSNQYQNVSNIAYSPIIMATPTDYSTVYTTLLRLKECMNSLGQTYAPVIFDMSLLAKALEIVWCKGDELKGVIPIEGGMHMLISVFAGIGYLYGDAGLKQLLEDSGVYASGTVSNILAGKDFDRALTAFKLVDEVLHTRFLTSFEIWCRENNKELNSEVTTMLSQLRDMNTETDILPYIENWSNIVSIHVLPLLNEFKDECRQLSPTFKLWDDYLMKVSVPLKMFISSTRSPNWTTQHFAKLSLLPLLFASNRTTYAKYMTAQILQMNRLPAEVEEGFKDGLFTAKLSDGTFNNVWLDYTLEVTQNKALKGSGGIIGLTLKENALARWFLSRPLASRYSMAFHKNINSTRDGQHMSHSTTASKQKQYDKNVKKMVSMFDSNFIDPFDAKKTAGKLVHFATGVQATEEVEKSMVGCLDKGQEMLETFVTDRIVTKADGTDPPEKNFFSPMSRSNVKTMVDMKKKVHVKKSKETISGEVMFQRLLAVNTYKKVPSGRVFSFENTTMPMSLFIDGGKMLNCKKSDFMGKLEALLPGRTTSIDNADTVIFDGMAVIQTLTVQNPYSTFKDMANMFMKYIQLKARSIKGVTSVHILFDKYTDYSLKSETRQNRGDNLSNNVHIHGDLCIPKDWKAYLSNGINKQRLAEFYTGYLRENISMELQDIRHVYISGGLNETCLKLTADSCEEVRSLNSNQEEADSQIILHTRYSVEQGSDTIVVFSPDTDVLVLLLHHRQNIGGRRLYMCTGRVSIHTDLRRFIPVHDIYDQLSNEQNNILLTIYCLTGCDTTSSFYGKGKKKIFKQFIQNAHQYQLLGDLGEDTTFTSAQKQACTSFVVQLYGCNNCVSLNQARCKKALLSTHPRSLPPTENSFHLHCLRSILQLWIWKHALTPIHDLPSPSDFGYSYDLDKKCLKPVPMSQPVAAPELLNDMVCLCSSCNEACSCFKNGQPCTIACSCEASVNDDSVHDGICTNMYTLATVFTNNNDDSESED